MSYGRVLVFLCDLPLLVLDSRSCKGEGHGLLPSELLEEIKRAKDFGIY